MGRWGWLSGEGFLEGLLWTGPGALTDGEGSAPVPLTSRSGEQSATAVMGSFVLVTRGAQRHRLQSPGTQNL